MSCELLGLGLRLALRLRLRLGLALYDSRYRSNSRITVRPLNRITVYCGSRLRLQRYCFSQAIPNNMWIHLGVHISGLVV